MDKNTIIGLTIIFLILIGFSLYNQPSDEELAQQQRRRDSIERVRNQKELQEKKENEVKEVTENEDTTSSQTNDSLVAEQLKQKYGSFSQAVKGTEKFITLENDKIELKISTKGGRPYSVRLKDYKRFDSTDVILFNGDKNKFGLKFFADNRGIKTNYLFFTPTDSTTIYKIKENKQTIKLQLKASDSEYIEYIYSLEPNSYLVDFKIKFVGLENIINATTEYVDLNWELDVLAQEKGREWEKNNTSIYYKHYGDEVDYLSEQSDEEKEEISTRVKWVAFKQQFFSSILIHQDYLSNANLSYTAYDDKSPNVKNLIADLSFNYENGNGQTEMFTFYFGPNKYKILNNTLEEQDLQLENLIPLGSFIFRWVNVFAIIPLFNVLGNVISNYGLLIFVMTIIIKLVLFPLTFKSYVSSAKMRVLKPQIDEINKKIPKEDAMKRQQATMSLYKKVGVNPLGGCLPMLLQMPILIAMFRFFPASIELRQKSFLWADDLSTYDSILELPFSIPFYGDHVSLFCLLMGISMLLTTKFSSGQMDTGNSQMPGMKTMMYFMPVMMLFWFNSYAAGLSYYYLVSNLITLIQTLSIRRFIDDDEVLKKLNAQKKKPVKKSNFQKRLEDAAKQRGYKPPKR